MPRVPDLYGLLWKFITRQDEYGMVWWRWQVYTGAGHFVASSERDFQTLTECEEDAMLNGYIPPAKRR
jgi:hypothetical protein